MAIYDTEFRHWWRIMKPIWAYKASATSRTIQLTGSPSVIGAQPEANKLGYLCLVPKDHEAGSNPVPLYRRGDRVCTGASPGDEFLGLADREADTGGRLLDNPNDVPVTKSRGRGAGGGTDIAGPAYVYHGAMGDGFERITHTLDNGEQSHTVSLAARQGIILGWNSAIGGNEIDWCRQVDNGSGIGPAEFYVERAFDPDWVLHNPTMGGVIVKPDGRSRREQLNGITISYSYVVNGSQATIRSVVAPADFSADDVGEFFPNGNHGNSADESAVYMGHRIATQTEVNWKPNIHRICTLWYAPEEYSDDGQRSYNSNLSTFITNSFDLAYWFDLGTDNLTTLGANYTGNNNVAFTNDGTWSIAGVAQAPLTPPASLTKANHLAVILEDRGISFGQGTNYALGIYQPRVLPAGLAKGGKHPEVAIVSKYYDPGWASDDPSMNHGPIVTYAGRDSYRRNGWIKRQTFYVFGSSVAEVRAALLTLLPLNLSDGPSDDFSWAESTV